LFWFAQEAPQAVALRHGKFTENWD